MRRRAMEVVLAAAVVSTLTGCASSNEPAVRATATSFQLAVARHDAPTACGLLSDEARTRLETASDRPCADALGTLGLPADAVRTTQVWGDEAAARLATQTLFLAEFRDGWRVTGAGCIPRKDQPYVCLVRA